MDCMMPIMDGFEATRQIRAIFRQRLIDDDQVQIVALSAMSHKTEVEKSVASGMNSFSKFNKSIILIIVTKPPSFKQLRDILVLSLPQQ